MDQEVEEVSFLPGEMVLNKKAVYEPTKGQRFRQIVCSRGWAICILLAMGAVMLAVSLIAAFARPGSIFTESACPASDGHSTPDSSQKPDFSGKEEPQTYIATNGKPFPWKDVRLPKTIIPEAYQLFLHANITKSFFTGRVHMNMRVVQDTDFVVFHTEELNLTDVKLMQESGDEVGNSLTFDKELEIIAQLEYPRNQMYYLRVATLLRAGIRLQLRADFRGSLEGVSRMDGLYKSSYTVNEEERYMISTQFEASHARKAFPCMDEPNLKANFSMSIVRENRHISLFNTKLIRSSPYQDDLVLDEYEESVKMSTYLVAFVVCDFKNISKITPSGVTVRIFAPEDRIYMGQYALDVATTVLEYYAKFFGVPYPLSKQDLIAIPNFANGAMENWGLITFRDRAILYDPAVSSVSSKEWVAIVIAHELAHQWFGNLVTMKWWNDLWLNEGFASFVENIGTDIVDKDFHVMDGFVSRDFTSALTLDGLVSSHPIDVTIHSADEVEAAFDDISYKKGASLIRMLQGFVGEENFKSALTAYLQRHAYGNAETSDLWDAFQDMSNLPSDLTVSKVMATWTEQMNYPVVTVSRKLGRLHLRQDRFLMLEGSSQSEKNKKDTESPYGYKWYIPFTFTTSADPGKKTQVWMKMGSAELELSDKSLTWLKGNVGTLGFYRVNYDEEGWQAIIRQLYRDHTVFSVADRIGIIDDAFTLARAGLVDYTVPLDITKYLVNETSYFVWSRAVDFLEFLKGRLVMEEEYDLINSYTLSLAKPLIDKQGWDKKTKYTEAKMQALMIHQGYELDYQPVLDKALQIFGQWKKDENTEVSSDLRSTVYRTGVKYGNKADWDLVYERYNHSVIPSESSNLLYSLAGICDARILGILLEYSLDDSKIKSQDTSDVISSVSANMNGGLLAWRFLHRRWDDLQEMLGTFSYFGRMIKNMLAQFNTQYDYDEAVEFFNTKELGTATRSVKQGLEYVESHIRWSEDNLAVVKLWFKKMANIP